MIRQDPQGRSITSHSNTPVQTELPAWQREPDIPQPNRRFIDRLEWEPGCTGHSGTGAIDQPTSRS